MGILRFFKKAPHKTEDRSDILLAMPMFNSGDKYDISKIVQELKDFWKLNITNVEGDNDAASFNVDGETVAITYVAAHIPVSDIEGTSKYAYNWTNALKDLKDHNGHAIVAVMSTKRTILERFKILSKVLCSIFATSTAIGVYKGDQSLLIPRKQYLDNIGELKENGNPVSLWIYLGLKQTQAGNSAYTYGLKAYQLQEIEIINSQLNLEELYEFISNITSYVIGGNITLQDGETIGYTAEQKIKVTSSQGQFVDGQTIKLEL